MPPNGVAKLHFGAHFQAPGLPNQTAGTVDVYGLQILDAILETGNAVEAEEDTAASALLLKHEFLDTGADDVTLATVETLKTDRSKACMSVPIQVGARTLQLSKLMMEKAYYLHMRRLFPKMRLLFTDTDSVMVQIFELQDPLHAMAEANLNGAALFDVAGKSKDLERDLSALSAAARAKAIEVACAPRCTASSRPASARSRACRRRR